MLDALGGRFPVVVLRGTLDDPKLQLPDIAKQVLENKLKGTAEGLLQEKLGGLLKKGN